MKKIMFICLFSLLILFVGCKKKEGEYKSITDKDYLQLYYLKDDYGICYAISRIREGFVVVPCEKIGM